MMSIKEQIEVLNAQLEAIRERGDCDQTVTIVGLTAAIETLEGIDANAKSLTIDERKVVTLLARAWNAFMELPDEHHSDRLEFLSAIHWAQEKVLCRPARREMNRG